MSALSFFPLGQVGGSRVKFNYKSRLIIMKTNLVEELLFNGFRKTYISKRAT